MTPSSPKHLSGMTILVADDEVEFAVLLETFLSQQGARVITQTSGLAAFDTLQGQSVDALITDLRMPNGTGIELLRKIRRNRSSLPKVPRIIVNTGYIDQGESYLYALGASRILSKPYPLDALLDALSDAS